MLNALRQLFTPVIPLATVTSPKLDVPTYAENWGNILFGGVEVRRAVLVLIVPDQNSPLFGMELQVHRYSDNNAKIIAHLCHRPGFAGDKLVKYAKRIGLPFSPGSGCPLGTRLKFLQNHSARGLIGFGRALEFEATPKNINKFLRGVRDSNVMIPAHAARNAVADLLDAVLKQSFNEIAPAEEIIEQSSTKQGLLGSILRQR